MITYEYPFNEKVRTLLRLEGLHDRLQTLLERPDVLDQHLTLTTLFELDEVSTRADMRATLQEEMAHHRQALHPLRDNPQVQTDALDRILSELAQCSQALETAPIRPGQPMRDSDWLMAVRSRSAMPGCHVVTDLPLYHAWRHRDERSRRQDLLQWAAPFTAQGQAVAILMQLLRGTAQPEAVTAPAGSLQQALGEQDWQLARIRLDEKLGAIPEFQTHRHLLWVRFVSLDREGRVRPYERNLDFELSLCVR